MPNYYDRYSQFRVNGTMKTLPGITIPVSPTDKYAVFKQGITRLDKLSNLYYNNPYSGWLIMLANPQFGGLEFNIPDATTLRIPFPYESAVQSYNTAVSNFEDLYGT